MTEELTKVYDPKSVEPKWYQFWEAGGYFHAPTSPSRKQSPYCIVIPPPNVTGLLHMGHALNNTLQDILIRWKRMEGHATLWQPGTDHAGIATQNVVEREILKAEGKTRHEIGRDELIRRIWEWKERYGDRILSQLKAIGASCDWGRTRFTFDEGLSRAVREGFVRLYEEGLIYRGKYIVNWCPRCRTALADDEVSHRDEKGSLWYIRYPLVQRQEARGKKQDKIQFIVVATTRPETVLGDTAVAVNPKDDRYAHLIGKMVHLPETGREIPIIADDFVDATFGTGAVKVTPAHDPNDFQIGERHNLPRINVMNEDATMNADAGAKYAGLSREKCRERIVDALKEAGLLEKVEDHAHAVGHCYRCHTTIEPWLSDQWFVKMRPLAEAAIRATEDGKIKFHPDRWEAFYLQWLENARDWCISRQIWWGHRIPVWYCKSCPPIVSREAPAKCPHCGGTELAQDNDVLDTWFSSSLWPFSALGWPDKTAELAAYYPTRALVTDRGIIYFWVARMVMMGLKMTGKIPFSDVYIHGTILDELGRKMSKSLGNGIDPIDVIDKYGSDAMRFSLVVLSTEGQDLKLSESKFEMGRNFCNKLWNAARFVMMNLDQEPGPGIREPTAPGGTDLTLADKWILDRLQHTINTVLDELDAFHFSTAAQNLYHFVWNEFCDWYLEAAKLALGTRDPSTPLRASGMRDAEETQQATKHTLRYVLSEILRLCHPFLPFITEEIWSTLNPKEGPLIVAKYPVKEECRYGKDSILFENFVKDPVEKIRNIRGESNVPPEKRIPLSISSMDMKGPSPSIQNWCSHYVEHLARVDRHIYCKKGKEPPDVAKAATAVVAQQTIYVPLAGLIDIQAETARLTKEIGRAEKEIAAIQAKLANEAFLNGAPKEVVSKERDRLVKAREKLTKLGEALDKMKMLT